MTPLIAEQLFNDPRLKAAKNALIQTMHEHTQQIKGIRPPDSARAVEYQEYIQQIEQLRGAPLWHRYIGSGIGNGAFVELLDGSIKYDLICGIGPHFFGHSHPINLEACLNASLSDIVMQGNLQQNKDSLMLMKLLIQASGMDHCFLTTGGALAIENAIKIAFQKRFPAQRIIAFERCFMGRTLAASQITDKPQYREGLPINYFIDYIPFFDHNDPAGSIKKTIDILKSHFKRYPKQHAIICMELVQGEGGLNTAPREFFLEIIQVAKENHVLIFFDEVQTFARTLELFATHHFNLQEYADIITIGKISHACATLFRNSVAPLPGLLSQTFISSTSAIQSSIAVVSELLQGNYYGHNGQIAHLHSAFLNIFKDISARYPQLLRGPYGIGSMIGFTVYDGNPDKTTAYVKALFEAGIVAFIAGAAPARVRFLPPIGVLKPDDFTTLGKIIEEVLLAKQ